MNAQPAPEYAYDEPTPADRVMHTTDGAYIIRCGEPPIPVGCGASNADGIPDDEAWGGCA